MWSLTRWWNKRKVRDLNFLYYAEPPASHPLYLDTTVRLFTNVCFQFDRISREKGYEEGCEVVGFESEHGTVFFGLVDEEGRMVSFDEFAALGWGVATDEIAPYFIR